MMRKRQAEALKVLRDVKHDADYRWMYSIGITKNHQTLYALLRKKLVKRSCTKKDKASKYFDFRFDVYWRITPAGEAALAEWEAKHETSKGESK